MLDIASDADIHSEYTELQHHAEMNLSNPA